MTAPRWHDVPESSRDAWRRAFATPSVGVDVDAACPVCGERRLHRYYQVGARLPASSPPSPFIARGSSWEWCSHCGTYEHAAVLVPAWWRCDVVVDERRLTALPDALEAAVAERA